MQETKQCKWKINQILTYGIFSKSSFVFFKKYCNKYFTVDLTPKELSHCEFLISLQPYLTLYRSNINAAFTYIITLSVRDCSLSSCQVKIRTWVIAPQQRNWASAAVVGLVICIDSSVNTITLQLTALCEDRQNTAAVLRHAEFNFWIRHSIIMRGVNVHLKEELDLHVLLGNWRF